MTETIEILTALSAIFCFVMGWLTGIDAIAEPRKITSMSLWLLVIV